MKSNPRSAGTSRACRQCRIKRKKCDLMSPCARCVASNSSCSGPAEGALFVNRHKADFTKHSQRDVLQGALTQRLHHGQTRMRTTLKTCRMDHIWPAENTRISNIVSDHGTTRLLYASLLDDFYTTSFATSKEQNALPCIFNYSTIALCLRSVVTMGSASREKPNMLDLGVFSLLGLYFGQVRPKHSELVDLSRRSYSLTVHSLRDALTRLNDVRESNSLRTQRLAQNMFCLSLALILFELVDVPTATDILDIHIDGALGILQQIDPKSFEISATQKQLLSGFRGIAYASAARRRNSLFLDEPQWLKVFSDGSDVNKIDRLYNIAILLPRLLAQTNSLKSVDAEVIMDSDTSLLSDYNVLKSMFHNWYLQQPPRCDDISLASQTDTKTMNSDNRQIDDRDMLHLSTMLLELDMGFSDLMSISPHQSLFRDMFYAHEQTGTIETQKLLAVMTSSLRSLRGSSEGKLVAAVPSETLERYLKRSRSRHIASR